tara:strand:+ start:2346 stop:2930 length:585 start_codon:yes stop_codon:yes gene_type:complete
MVNQLSRQITRTLVNNDIIDFDEVSIYQYGLEVMIMTSIELLGLIILGLVTGYVTEVLVFIVAFSSVRIYAGGYHANTVFKCFSLIVLLLGIDIGVCKLVRIESIPMLSVLIAIVAFALIYIYSPIAVTNRPITEKERLKFRRISVNLTFLYLIMVLVLSILNIHTWYLGVFSIGLLLEAMTLPAEKYRKEILK